MVFSTDSLSLVDSIITFFTTIISQMQHAIELYAENSQVSLFFAYVWGMCLPQEIIFFIPLVLFLLMFYGFLRHSK